MDYQFREIRKSEREQVLEFAKAQGCSIEPETLRHHLGLTVKSDGQLIAAALCVEQQPEQFIIEILAPDIEDEALITQLADRCLRKMQSETIASVRLHSPSEASTQTIWTQANWLDRVEETPPPTDGADDTSQAA